MSAERTQRTPRKLDRAKVLELAEQGLKTADIAKHQGVAPSTVFRYLQQTEPERQALEAFKKDRGDVFAGLAAKALDLQGRLLDTYDDCIIAALKPSEKGSLIHQLGIAAAVHYDKERLERGQSTANISILGRLLGEAEAGLGTPTAKPAPVEGTHEDDNRS